MDSEIFGVDCLSLFFAFSFFAMLFTCERVFHCCLVTAIDLVTCFVCLAT
jgi:hypothetical protein